MDGLRALVLIYDIRGFTAASRRLRTADLGAFATAAHRVILDLFAAHPPTFVKNLGDGHLLLWECPDGPDPALLASVVDGAQRARLAFAAFATQQRGVGRELPGRVGIGVAFGEVHRSDDYYGTALNLASRLQGVARPEGLALDTGVFEALAQEGDALRSRFKRARVALKGLGGTLVWVDRPFAWSRALAPVAKGLALLALPVGYVALCDAGLQLPGGQAVRRLLDAQGLVWLRPVHADADVRAAAAVQRESLRRAILANAHPQGWLYASFAPASGSAEDLAEREAENRRPDVWSLSQACYALLSDPGLSAAEYRERVRGWLDVPFAPGVAVEAEGRLWGWRPSPDRAYSEAEPTLWTVAALARALRRSDLHEGGERALLERRLAAAQEAALVFRPLDTGAWNIFPRQVQAGRHSPYATVVALLALLEVRAAGAPWGGSVEERDRLLASTAAFLAGTFEPGASPPGWRRTADPSDKVSAGLTMQALATLLRAEAEAGVALPDALREAVPGLLVERAEAHATDDYDMGEFKVLFLPPGATEPESRSEGINFLSHPWAIECAARYLARAERRGADPADVVAVRRALGVLVADMGPAAVEKALGGFVFVASETLLGLSRLAVEVPR